MVVLKYENGSIYIDSSYSGETLDITEFIGELLINENMDYLQECVPLAKKIEEISLEHLMSEQRKEMSLSSAML
jgi:hypothetical protein